MFAVINYVVKTDDLIEALRNIRRHLKSGALLVLDTWYGPAVLSLEPSARIKIVKDAGIKVIRTVVPELDTYKHTQKSNYHLLVIKNNKVIDEVREMHVLRFLFPQELLHYLTETDFEVLRFCEFPHLNIPPSESTWNVAVVSKAH